MRRARATGMLVFAVAVAVAAPAVIGVEAWQRAAAARRTIERLSEATEALGEHLAPLLGGESAVADRVIREWAAASGLRASVAFAHAARTAASTRNERARSAGVFSSAQYARALTAAAAASR